MNISELQKELADIKDKFGDLKVTIFDSEEQARGKLCSTAVYLSIDEERKQLTFVDFETAEAFS